MKKQSYQKNKRLRVFAGPNGSGKTTILNQIDNQFDIGIYINADEIEKVLKSKNGISLEDFGIKGISSRTFKNKILSHTLYQKALREGYDIDLVLDKNFVLNPNRKTHSYEAALLADIIRTKLLDQGRKITFETVMSHDSKIKFLAKAKKLGYKNYLYYISTESSIINIERVKQRVELGGHPVAEKKIKSRYKRSLELLRAAIAESYRSFIFDNSEIRA